MPEFTQDVEGATMIETSGDEIEIKYLHDVAYQSADGATLRLQVLSPTSRNGIAGPLPLYRVRQGVGMARARSCTC